MNHGTRFYPLSTAGALSKKSSLLILSLIVLVPLLIAASPRPANAGLPWLTDWNFRQSHDIGGAVGAGTGYQVKIKTYFDAPPGPSKFTNFTKYAGNPLTMPVTYPGAGAVHPDVRYFPGGMDGYKYWMTFTPYPPNDAEHPTIVRSNDGITWTGDGITNPVVAFGGGNLDADPDMIYVPDYGIWFMVWTVYTSGVRSDIALAYSTDGKAWTKYDGDAVNGNSNPIIVSGLDSGGQPSWEVSGGLSYLTEPSLMYENGKVYLFYCTYIGGNNRGKVGFATFTWDTGTKSIKDFQRHAANPVVDLPADSIFASGCGHADISKSGSTYYLYLVRQLQSSSSFELALLTSTDMISWTNKGRVLQRGTGGAWDDVHIYRSAPVTDSVGTIIDFSGSIALYYSAFSSTAPGGSGIGLATGTDAPPPTLAANETRLYAHSRADFGDVRFTKSDGTTLLDYWMESKVDGDSATFWVKVPDDLGQANATIYVYYGKSDATTTSDIKTASLWNQGDDFNGGSLDPERWVALYTTPQDTANYPEEAADGTLKLHLGYDAGIRGLSPHYADNLEMSLQAHAGNYVEMYLHNTAVTPAMLTRTGQQDSGDIPTNYRIMLDSGTKVYAQKRLPDGSSVYPNWPTGSTDATLKLRVNNGMITFLTGDTQWYSEPWDSRIARDCYVLIDGWGHLGETDWADNFWIRKYVEPEPAHLVWGNEETNAFTLTVTTEGSGTVAKSPDETGYHYGDVVQLTANPATGWAFSGWSGDLSGSVNPASITIDGNKAVKATFVLIPPTIPDLVVTDVNGPASAQTGETITVSAVVANQGTQPVPSKKGKSGITVKFYLSPDVTITDQDTTLGKSVIEGGLAGGASIPVTTTVRIPPGKSGEYYIGAIVDPDNAITEANESNNSGYDPTPIVIIKK